MNSNSVGLTTRLSRTCLALVLSVCVGAVTAQIVPSAGVEAAQSDAPARAVSAAPDAVTETAPVQAPETAPSPLPPGRPAPVIRYATVVWFDAGSAELRPATIDTLQRVALKSRELDPEVVMAIGHTDASGVNPGLQLLSIRRAEAVKDYLARKGVERNRIFTEGKNKTLPVADNATKAGRAANNRVEIELVGMRADSAPAGS